MNKRQWNNRFYRALKSQGITKAQAGASSHGFRHAYAKERYEKMTGFDLPVMLNNRQYFRANANRISGTAWRKTDQNACLILKSELGHDPDRDDVISQYVGRV